MKSVSPSVQQSSHSEQRGVLSPLLVLFFGILVVSTSSIFIRFAQKEAASIVIAAYRLFFASIILLPITLIGYRKELFHLKRSQIVLVVLSESFYPFTLQPGFHLWNTPRLPVRWSWFQLSLCGLHCSLHWFCMSGPRVWSLLACWSPWLAGRWLD